MIQIMYHKKYIYHTVAPYSKPNLSTVLSLNYYVVLVVDAF